MIVTPSVGDPQHNLSSSLVCNDSLMQNPGLQKAAQSKYKSQTG